MTLRVLLHTAYYAPELTAIAKYNAEMMQWLRQRGHEVRVVSMPPHFPAWRVHEGFSAARYSLDLQDGVPVWRCPTWIPRQPGGLARVVSTLSMTLSSLPTMLRQAFWRPHVVIGVEPPLLAFAVARLTAALSGARTWLHVQDLEIDAAFDLSILRGHFARRLALGVERVLMRGCDRVSTISGRMAGRLLAKGVPPERLRQLPNWIDLAGIPADASGADYRQELALPPSARVALYAGNMSQKQGLQTLVDVAQRLRPREDLWFVMVGDGAARASLIERAAGLPRMRFLPIQPADRLPDLLALADVHLLPQRRAAADLVMPSKLTGMLASGRPVVVGAAEGTELATVVDGLGLRVAPEDPDAMAAAIEQLLDDPALARELGAAGRRYASTAARHDGHPHAVRAGTDLPRASAVDRPQHPHLGLTK